MVNASRRIEARPLQHRTNLTRWPCVALQYRENIDTVFKKFDAKGLSLSRCEDLQQAELAKRNRTCSSYYRKKAFTRNTAAAPAYWKCASGSGPNCTAEDPFACNGHVVLEEGCPGHRAAEHRKVACDFAISAIAAGEHTRRELHLFLLTMVRFEMHRPLYLLVDAPISRWLASTPEGLEMLSAPHTIPFPAMCPDAGQAICELPAKHPQRVSKQRKFIFWQKIVPRGMSNICQRLASACEAQGCSRYWTIFGQHARVTPCLYAQVPMAAALRNGERGVLALDSDYILLQPLPAMGPEELGLMPCNCHYNHYQRTYGMYSAGMVFARRLDVLEVWRKAATTSRYFEQAALDAMELRFRFFLLGPSNNVNFQQTSPQSAKYSPAVGSFSLQYPDAHQARMKRNGTILWQPWPTAPVTPLHALHVHLICDQTWWFEFMDLSVYYLTKSTVRDDLCMVYPEFCAGLTKLDRIENEGCKRDKVSQYHGWLCKNSVRNVF